MTSIKHSVVVTYLRLFRRIAPAPNLETAAARIRQNRSTEKPEPPRGMSDRVRITCSDEVGFPVYRVEPRGERDQGPEILYLHGGSYVSDLTPEHWNFIEYLTTQLRTTVIVPRYPLAPEASWRESRQALVRLAFGKSNRKPPVLAGDSAGAGLALALAQAAARESVPTPALLLLSPWVELTMASSAPATPAVNDPWLDPRTLRQNAELWADGDDLTRPELSPVHGPLHDLPPTLVLSGTRDVIHPQVLDLVSGLRLGGTDVTFAIGKDLVHVYPLLPVPEAAAARRRVVTFLGALSPS